MKFADIHMHLLFNVDDGAADEEEMKEILNTVNMTSHSQKDSVLGYHTQVRKCLLMEDI